MYKKSIRVWMVLTLVFAILIQVSCMASRNTSTPPTSTPITNQASPTPKAEAVVNNKLPVGLQGKVIHITDDGAEWPPYTYYERMDEKKTGKVVGYSVDVIKEIFNKNGIQYTIELLPWKRALTEVQRGKNYQMLLSATTNLEREEKYYVSDGYYSTTPYYFYSKKFHPEGLEINSSRELKKYKIAGLLGHNYNDYGLKNEEVYMGAQNYESLVQQLHTGRYDIFLESFEILAGYSKLNMDVLADKKLGYAKVPDMQPVEFHMLFTRDETGAALKKMIDTGLDEMRASGRLEALLEKYMP